MTADDLRAAIAASEEIAGGPKRRLLALPDGHLELLAEEWAREGATSATVFGAFGRGAISFDCVKDMRRVLQGKAEATQTGPRKPPVSGAERRNGRREAPSGVEVAAELHAEPPTVLARDLGGVDYRRWSAAQARKHIAAVLHHAGARRSRD